MGADMKSSKFSKQLKNNKGFASIEATVLMVLFVSMLYYTFGFFGIVHTGILHNIGARTYAFETFRHRSNVMYFRSNNAAAVLHYYNHGMRLHGVNTDTQANPDTQIATERPISMGLELDEKGRKPSTHNNDIFQKVPANGRNTSIAVNPVWIMTMYGLCLNSECGG